MDTAIPHQVRVFLEKHQLKALEFAPGSTPTSPMAAAQIGCEVGQIAKSLVFRDKKGGFHLVVMSGTSKVSSGKLKRLVGADVSMATPDETRAQTGFRVGGVCPFGVPASLPIYIDASLKPWTTIYPAAGNDASGVPLTYDLLVQVTGGSPCDVASNPGIGTETRH